MSAKRVTPLLICTAVLAVIASLPLVAQPTPGIENQRFFTTPEERQRLDELRERSHRAPVKKKAVVRKKSAPLPPTLPRVDVQGIVVRSGGPDAVWVNDGNTLRGDRLEGGVRVQAGADGRARILLPDRGSVALRPGQSYDPASGITSGIRIRKNP